MSETWRQDRLAINYIDKVAIQLGWMWREQTSLDYGIDGHIEICDDDGRPNGRLFAIQSKGGDSYFYRRKGDNVLTIRLQRKHLEYWKKYALPVLVVGFFPLEGRAYWLHVQDHLVQDPELLEAESESVSIEILAENMFDVNAKDLLEKVQDRHWELISSKISSDVDILEELLDIMEQAGLDPEAFQRMVFEWQERAPEPIKTRVAKSGITVRLQQTLDILQRDAPSLPETHVLMAKHVVEILTQGLQGAGVRQIVDRAPHRLADQGSMLLYWEIGSECPQLMLADYIGEVHSNRLSVILNSDSSLTLRVYQNDGSVLNIESEIIRPQEWFVALVVWECDKISLWVNGQQFGPTPLSAGFDNLGPLLLFGLDIENKLSADVIRSTPPNKDPGLDFQKNGIWSCWLSSLLYDRALDVTEIASLTADPFAPFRPRLCVNGKCPDCGAFAVQDQARNNLEPDERLKRLDGSKMTNEDFSPHPPAVWCVCTKCGRPCLNQEGFGV